MTDLFRAARLAQTTHPQATNEKDGYLVVRADHPYEAIASLNGHAPDQGWVHRLSDRLLTGDPTGEFNLGVYRMDPGMVHPLHLHAAAAEFYYVLRGVARFTLGDEQLVAGPDTGMYIPRGMPHAIAADSGESEPMELLYVFSNPDLDGIDTRWL